MDIRQPADHYKLRFDKLINNSFRKVSHHLRSVKEKLKERVIKIQHPGRETEKELIKRLISTENNANNPYYSFFYALYQKKMLLIEKPNSKRKFLINMNQFINIDDEFNTQKIIANYFKEGELDNEVSYLHFFQKQVKYMAIAILFFIKYINSLQ